MSARPDIEEAPDPEGLNVEWESDYALRFNEQQTRFRCFWLLPASGLVLIAIGLYLGYRSFEPQSWSFGNLIWLFPLGSTLHALP